MTKEQVMQGNGLLDLIYNAKDCLNKISPDKVDFKASRFGYTNTLPATVIGVEVCYDGQQSNQSIRLSLDAPKSLRETIDKLKDNAASEIKAIVEKYYADVINIAEQKFAEL